jgi:hypothetical protein
MSTALRLSIPDSAKSRRTAVLSVVSALVAAASVAVTLAVAGGGSDATSRPSAAPATATPDRATLYQRGAEVPQRSGAIDGARSAERFHHFR